MKTITKPLLFAGLWSVLVVASCKKDNTNDVPPPQTFKNKNTFNCLINGKAWKPDASNSGYISAYIINSGEGYNKDKQNYFATIDARSENKSMVLHLSGVKGPGIYPICQNVPKNVIDIFVYTMNPVGFGWYYEYWKNELNNIALSKSYLTSSENTGQVVITKFIIEPAPLAGTFHGIIAGTFQFKASFLNSGNVNETVNIQEGNFEVEFWM